MKSKISIALDTFDSGKNCAQSVLTAYSEQCTYNLKDVIAISSGFGGGMGSLQQTCGAVTGAFMVIGCMSENSKVEINQLIQQFAKLFINEMGSLNCGELTGCDFSTEESKRKFSENKIRDKVCNLCISKSIEIIDSLQKET